jgi:hypothetical protein
MRKPSRDFGEESITRRPGIGFTRTALRLPHLRADEFQAELLRQRLDERRIFTALRPPAMIEMEHPGLAPRLH